MHSMKNSITIGVFVILYITTLGISIVSHHLSIFSYLLYRIIHIAIILSYLGGYAIYNRQKEYVYSQKYAGYNRAQSSRTGIVVGISIIGMILSVILRPWADMHQSVNAQATYLCHIPPIYTALALIVAAVNEEALMRALLFHAITPLYSNRWVFIICSSLLFSLLHINQSLLTMVYAVCAGLLLAILYHRQRNLMMVIFIHAFHNCALAFVACAG